MNVSQTDENKKSEQKRTSHPVRTWKKINHADWYFSNRYQFKCVWLFCFRHFRCICACISGNRERVKYNVRLSILFFWWKIRVRQTSIFQKFQFNWFENRWYFWTHYVFSSLFMGSHLFRPVKIVAKCLVEWKRSFYYDWDFNIDIKWQTRKTRILTEGSFFN